MTCTTRRQDRRLRGQDCTWLNSHGLHMPSWWMRLGLGVSPTFVKCFGCFEVGAFQSTAACCCLFLVFLCLLSDFPACSIPHFLHSSFLCFFVCLFACLFACLCACSLVRFSFVVRLLFFFCLVDCLRACFLGWFFCLLGFRTILLFRSNNLWNLLVCDREISVPQTDKHWRANLKTTLRWERSSRKFSKPSYIHPCSPESPSSFLCLLRVLCSALGLALSCRVRPSQLVKR